MSYTAAHLDEAADLSRFPQHGKFKPRMKPNTPGKLKYGRTILISLGFFTSQSAWSYYNFIMPLILREFLQGISLGVLGADTFVGVIMILDNLVAILMLPYFGIISDHTQSKFGKRMPYILIGCTLGAVFFSLIPFMRVLAGLFIIIMLFNLSMAFYRSCSMSLMPDLTDPSVRSTGSAITNLMGAFAYIMGLSGPIIMDAIFDTSTDEGRFASRAGGFIYIGAAMIIALTILFLTVRETPTGTGFLKVGKNPIAIDPITLEYLGEIPEPKGEKVNKMAFLKTVFTEQDKSALFMLLAIFASSFGFNAIETYYSSFATLWLKWSDAQTSLALMMAPVSLALTAVPVGKIADKIGRKKSVMIGLIGLCVCVEVLHYTGDYRGTGMGLSMATIFLVGFFYAMIAINAIVMVWQLAPEGKLGAYTGAYYLFSQLAAIVSPVVAGLEFDVYVALNPQKIDYFGQGYQYRMLFVYVLIWQLVALLCLSRVKKGEDPSMDKDKIRQLQEEFGDG